MQFIASRVWRCYQKFMELFLKFWKGPVPVINGPNGIHFMLRKLVGVEIYWHSATSTLSHSHRGGAKASNASRSQLFFETLVVLSARVTVNLKANSLEVHVGFQVEPSNSRNFAKLFKLQHIGPKAVILLSKPFLLSEIEVWCEQRSLFTVEYANSRGYAVALQTWKKLLIVAQPFSRARIVSCAE